MSLFEALLGYYLHLSYKNNNNLKSKYGLVDKNTAILCNLIKELKTNLVKSLK